MNEFLWVEKYRPKNIEHCILPDDLKKTFKSFVDAGEVPNLLLCGTAAHSPGLWVQRSAAVAEPLQISSKGHPTVLSTTSVFKMLPRSEFKNSTSRRLNLASRRLKFASRRLNLASRRLNFVPKQSLKTLVVESTVG